MALQHKIELASPQIADVSTVSNAPNAIAQPPADNGHASPRTAPQIQVVSDNSKLTAQLNALIEQQEVMKNQQAELNRDIYEIQFRLDTHSQNFRPLRTENSSGTNSNDTLSSPNLEMGLSPLLPPRM